MGILATEIRINLSFPGDEVGFGELNVQQQIHVRNHEENRSRRRWGGILRGRSGFRSQHRSNRKKKKRKERKIEEMNQETNKQELYDVSQYNSSDTIRRL
jgi:hypothetical protein